MRQGINKRDRLTRSRSRHIRYSRKLRAEIKSRINDRTVSGEKADPVNRSKKSHFGGSASREIRRPVKILVVEDDVISQLILTTTLERWGYEVISVSNGNDAVELLLVRMHRNYVCWTG